MAGADLQQETDCNFEWDETSQLYCHARFSFFNLNLFLLFLFISRFVFREYRSLQFSDCLIITARVIGISDWNPRIEDLILCIFLILEFF